MGVFGAFFGRRGDTGFTGPMLGASSGVVGFNVAMFLRPVCEVFRARRCAGLGCSAALAALLAVGFCTTRSLLGVCRRRVGASCRAIPPVWWPGDARPAQARSLMSCNSPPLGGGEAATHSGVVPKVQTTSAKNVENGVSWARWTTFWAHRCLARCTCSRVSPLF